MNRVARVLLSALCGVLLFLACASFDIWPLAWIGFVPLLFVLLDRDGMPAVQRPFFYGWIAGAVASAGGFYWITHLLMRFGNLPLVAALPIFLLFVGYQGLTFGIFASLLCRLRSQLEVPVTFLAAICFTACELCVPYIFPFYVAITQAWVRPVIQIAEITGPLGVTFLLVLSGGAIFDVINALRRRKAGQPFSFAAPGWAALLIVANVVYGSVRIHQVEARRSGAEKVKVGVVQANIGIHEKFVENLREQQAAVHQKLSAELESRGAELILWPESSYPYVLRRPVTNDLPKGHPYRVRNGFQTPLVFGALTLDVSGRSPVPYNTALMLGKDDRIVGSFDKNFLLVFGEYIPFVEQMAWLEKLIPAMSNFGRGFTTTTFPFEKNGKTYQLGPMICYEDIVPAFGRRLFAADPPVNLLVNITNDAWFGATSEPWEHMALSVYRAVEHRVDLIRAVNTGVSVFVDATGKVYDKTRAVDPKEQPGVTPDVLLNEAALMMPSGLYQNLGETFGGMCLFLTIVLSILARKRAGNGVRFGSLFVGALALHALVLLLALVHLALGEENAVGALYSVLAHRGEHLLPAAQVFRLTTRLTLALLVGSFALGAVLRGAKVEVVWAIVCVTVLPVLLFGQMEGSTGAVVILSGLLVVASLAGAKVGTRLKKAKGA